MSETRCDSKQRWVIKIGSALLTDNGAGLATDLIARLVDQMVSILRQGDELVLVSSGAVAAGMTRLGISERPTALPAQQAAAAIGQMGLVQCYESAFQRYDTHTAQILLTHDDLSNRKRYINARGTLLQLLAWGVVPVVNENDTVVTDEIRFGDNDTLAALVANLVSADRLVILTDQQGLFDSDPRKNSDAQLIKQIAAEDPRLEQMAGGSGGALGRGGMITKVRAARIAARSGAETIIAGGIESNVLSRLFQGESLGTRLKPQAEPLVARKRWLAGQLQMKGRLHLDEGAARVIQGSGRSLLPVGVVRVEGRFDRGEMVCCLDHQGQEVARGLVNYGSSDAGRIAGCSSQEIPSILGFEGEVELIHRDNLVLI